ncbi:MAG: SpoIIE family protein phosphatase [Rhodocyclaceae bacterium]|nr:SpoIIE family protein phosphatase [Rhodocyclaceae bacterium]
MGQVNTLLTGSCEAFDGDARMALASDGAQMMAIRRVPPSWRAGTEVRCWYLVMLEGAGSGARYRVGEQPLVIGGSEPADVVLHDAEVSGRHCSLVSQPLTGLILTELDAASDTLINGERLCGSVVVPEEAIVRIGSHVFRCERVRASDAARFEGQAEEIRHARERVRALLPAPIERGPLRVDWAFAPSAELGGDVFGYHWLDEDRFAVFLIDVSGHGPGAALHSATIAGVLSGGSLPGVNLHVPVEVVGALNDIFPMDDCGGLCFSIWYGVYDRSSGQFDYCSAGTAPAYLIDWEGAGVLSLQTRNLLVGALPGYRFRSESVAVPLGSRVYLFSDGAFEVRDEMGREGRLEDFRAQLLVPGSAPESRPSALLERARERASARGLEDDFTLVSIEFRCVS